MWTVLFFFLGVDREEYPDIKVRTFDWAICKYRSIFCQTYWPVASVKGIKVPLCMVPARSTGAAH